MSTGSLVRFGDRIEPRGAGQGWPVCAFTRSSCRKSGRVCGFTMIEMVIVILLIAVLSAGVAVFITRPIQSYGDLTRRAALVDVAETALRRMERDIRLALPNSVRLTSLGGGGYALEVLPTLDGGMYRAGSGDGTIAFNQLAAPSSSDTDFDVHKFLRYITVPSSSTAHRIVINNEGPTAANASDAYRATGSQTVITPVGTTISYAATGDAGVASTASAHHITLTPGYQFGATSFRQRFYIIQTPVTYLCSPNSANPPLGTLIRYEGYAIVAAQPSSATIAPLAAAASARIANNVSACSFNTTTLQIKNRALATLILSVEDSSEVVRLVHQVQVDNSP